MGSPVRTVDRYIALKFEPHLHTLHSDGQDSVASMFEACKAAGYDAVALTDHNTVSGLPLAEVIAHDLDLVLIPGTEITTFHGHSVVLGLTRVPEWRDLEARGMDALAAEVHAEGGLVTVSHPYALGSPVCSGCAWEWPIDPSAIDLMEVCSAPRPPSDITLAVWHYFLERGGRIAPVAAGDVHSKAAAAAERMATWVNVRERSRDGVLEALRERRVHVSMHPWSAYESAPKKTVEIATPGGRPCQYEEVRDAQGRVEAVSAPIWIDTSH